MSCAGRIRSGDRSGWCSRWAAAAMGRLQLWQLDVTASAFLAGGREVKIVTGIDDHSRYCVLARAVLRATARPVCQAFIGAMAVYGVPEEVLTDNGTVFTGRFIRPRPAEVLFERVCRENGITQLLTKPRSPTTTGKIERMHRSLQRELLDVHGPFASTAATWPGEPRPACLHPGRSRGPSGRGTSGQLLPQAGHSGDAAERQAAHSRSR